MADTLYDVTSGFYDAIDYDRLYSADQMNMPYKRIISEGVFATPQGTASTDFQVLALSGMNVKVCAGNAILGEKWVEMSADKTVTVEGNTSINPRIDSIILRVDRNSAARKASIVYRTGTAASSPVAPALDTSANVYEFRLADISVASGAASIAQSAITDQRGSAECPWITSLIYQMDTSTLFEQWRAAYDAAYAEHEDQWQQFFDELTQQLTLQTSVVTETGSYQTTGTKSQISMLELGITDYDRSTCEMMVFINGLYAVEGEKWTLSYDALTPANTALVFNTPLMAEQAVYVLIVKSIITGNATTLLQELSSLETRVDALENEVGSFPTFGNAAELDYTAGSNGLIQLKDGSDNVYPREFYKRYDMTYTSNSYVSSTNAARVRIYRYGQMGFLYLNLQISTSIPANTSSFEIGTFDASFIINSLQIVASQSGGSQTLLVTLSASGSLTVSNQTSVASGTGWFRAMIPVMFTDTSN